MKNFLYMRLNIRCDEESEKFYKIFWKLNKALGHLLLSVACGKYILYCSNILVRIKNHGGEMIPYG